jgi:hypothetical protein
MVMVVGSAGLIPAIAQEEFQPRNGVVVDTRPPEDGITIYVREGPPMVSGLGYQLADSICSVDNGTQLVATERRSVVNGEIWYRVEINSIAPADNNCPQPPFIGWVIGKFANGDDVVVLETVAETPNPRPSPSPDPSPSPSPSPSPDPSPTPTPDPSPGPGPDPDPTATPTPIPEPTATVPPTANPPSRTPAEIEQGIGGGLQWFTLLGHYLLLSLGAVFGFVVISIERADNDPDFDLFKSDQSLWEDLKRVRKIYWFRLCVAVFIVNLFRFAALNFVGVSNFKEELVLATFQFITQGFLGSFIGGFILAVLLLKFVSFTEE